MQLFCVSIHLPVIFQLESTVQEGYWMGKQNCMIHTRYNSISQILPLPPVLLSLNNWIGVLGVDSLDKRLHNFHTVCRDKYEISNQGRYPGK